MEHTRFYYWQRMRAEFKGAKGCSVGYSEGELSLKYHDTVVARFYFDTGTLILEHGGWRTYYTNNRINRFCEVLGLPVSVYQKSKRFFVAYETNDLACNLDTQRFETKRATIDWGHIDDGNACELAVETGLTVSP